MAQHHRTSLANSTITRDLRKLDRNTGNLYQSVAIISKRANQIAADIKEELDEKLSDFVSMNDGLEEVFENREQIELSKEYERLPKPTLVAIDEFLHDKVYFRNPSAEQE